MSFLKFWSSKKGGSGGKKDDADAKHGDGPQDPELEKRRLRHSLSISRSGRFKQRKRERSQIMDKPEIFGSCSQDGGPPTASSSSSSSLASQTQSDNINGNIRGGDEHSHHFHNSNNSGGNFRSSGPTNSPKFTCRNVNANIGAPGSLRMGHPVVT